MKPMSIKIFSLILLIAMVATPFSGCGGGGGPEEIELENVILLPQLNFELTDFIGEKVWTVGFYGDENFTGDGVAFLVLNFNMLMVDEVLPAHSFARLDGNLPPADMNSAEILVYGEVKDFAQTYGAVTIEPTPLVTVEEYFILTAPSSEGEWGDSYLLASMMEDTPTMEASAEGSYLLSSMMEIAPTTEAFAATGTKPQDCDRALIISGGVDENNNHQRYRDNVIAKYKKLKELGFTDEQIDVVYDGFLDYIEVDGVDIDDAAATKPDIEDIIEKYIEEMPASCTLTIFVTDHGTGYNDTQGYDGARPALPGTPEYENGKKYPESTFKIDARAKVYRNKDYTNPHGDVWLFHMDKTTNTLQLYKRVDGEWVLKGSDTDGDGWVTEAEAGEDIDGDGDKDNAGLSEAHLGAWQHRDNEWDSDGDGNKDVRMRWDGTKYVIERMKDGAWQKMGEDKDGDFDIDGADGGVDWNLDGDTNDQVGFHEGINLWGDAVLWDDELAELLKALSDKGVHILVEMISCFSGGFVDNLKDIVEKIVTGSSEDTKHWNRVEEYTAADGTKKERVYAADQRAFIENLDGIDSESWDDAWDKGTAADRAAWQAAGSKPVSENHPRVWEKPLIASESSFYELGGTYTLTIRIPQSLADKVYDIEIYNGLQKPRWYEAEVLQLPQGFHYENIDGGIKIESIQPFPLTPLVFKLKGAQHAESMRIHLTDQDHKNLGYITPRKETPPLMDFFSGFIDLNIDSSWGDYGCESFFDVYCQVDDLTDGVYPITYVGLYVNGELWDSWDVNTSHFEKTINDIPAGCGEIIETELVALNLVSTAPIVVATETFITPIVSEPPEPSEVLYGELMVSYQCTCNQDKMCMYCTVSATFSATDLTQGSYPITNVVLYLNGVKVFDSGTINTTYYTHTFTLSDATCNTTYNFQMIATNSVGLQVMPTKPITTPTHCQ
jgi:hypothetical protein